MIGYKKNTLQPRLGGHVISNQISVQKKTFNEIILVSFIYY